MASHDCSSNANCSNSVGSFQCNCQSGYTGNGRACQGKCKLVLPLRQMDCYQVKCTMLLAHILKNVETNWLIMTLEETTRETDRSTDICMLIGTGRIKARQGDRKKIGLKGT